MIDLLRAAARREFRSFIHLRFLLVLLSPLSFASDALAQFSVEGGRSDRPMGRMERGGGMRDEGIGIGIGIGIELGKTAAEQAAKENSKKRGGGTTTGPSERAARKGDKPGKEKKGDAKKNNEDAPPTAFPKDPAEGIDVPGGKVHRGTGTVTGYKGGPRPGIYCWVHLTDKTKCEKTAQYQFVTVNIEAKWGDGPKANINDAVKKLRENHGKALPTTANGVSVVPGQTVGDDYNDTRHQDPANLTDDNGNKVKDPNGKEIKAGPYNPQKIPDGGGDTGLIDAPHWSDTVSGLSGGLVPKSLGTQSKKQPAQPPPSNVGEITVLQHFRTYVYCTKPTRACLGYFEWDYNETITIEMKWKEATKGSDVADDMFGGNMQGGGGNKKDKNQPEQPKDKTWVPYFEAKGAPKIDGPTIGDWKPCP